MISEVLNMNGYGVYVFSSFVFTLVSFGVLYSVIKIQLNKELKVFETKFNNLEIEKAEIAKKQKTYREILAITSASKI
jgi:heme exporter protein D|tara:strand:- start:2324 stop:2557 length:234 start_codon:yes stop_codon:yes gene_type:complete